MIVKSRVRAGVLLAATTIGMTALGAVPASAAEGHWEATFLTLPAGSELSRGFVTGADGHGGYAGAFPIGDTSQIVTWKNGVPTVHGVPAGYEWAMAWDQNGSGTVVGDASDYDTGEARPFVLDANGFRVLPVPAGFSYVYGVAVNDQGDVVGNAHKKDDPGGTRAVLWRAAATSSGPELLPAGLLATDIDHDGTVLLSRIHSGGFVWKNGVLTEVTAPAGHESVSVSAINGGRIVGSAYDPAIQDSQAFVWSTPTTAEALPGGVYGVELNSHGLTTGLEPAPEPIMNRSVTWRGTERAGALPTPEGFGRAQGGVVSDDGTIAGIASDKPLDEGGTPVVWRYVR